MVVYCSICLCLNIYIGQMSQELHKRIQKHLSTISLAERDTRQGKKLTAIAKHYLKEHKGRTQRTVTVPWVYGEGIHLMPYLGRSPFPEGFFGSPRA